MGTLDNLKKEAKRRLKALGESAPRGTRPSLRDVQHALAREHGHESWRAMTEAIVREQPAALPRGGRVCRAGAGFGRNAGTASPRGNVPRSPPPIPR